MSNLNAQNKPLWSKVKADQSIEKSKNVQRETFPEKVVLLELDFTAIKEKLKTAPNRFKASKSKSVITVPNAEGVLERFQMFEATNFAPELQAKYPEIRSYVGKGLDDKNAQLRLSISPLGVQTMIFRADRRSEFIEPYSANGKVYAVYTSNRNKGKLPFTCSTPEQNTFKNISDQTNSKSVMSNTGELLDFRLAMSCNGEYTQYFGGTKPLALAAINNTMTRVNGVFEKDFAIHMTIIANTDLVIYTNPNSDPYTANLNQWNGQLQTTLTNNIGEANYDVGHMFGASGGGGNAGCIGCVCVDGQKGSGITSPADGIPMGDNFDIDYVAHELGHQFGGNHTFSMNNEGSGVNMEVGSGSTIMGYAGITTQDVQPHSDDYFHYATIFQVQTNMEGKTCPTVINLSNNAPVANAGKDYTIPKSTPFILTGSATDADGGDVLTYCWEQIDNAGSTQTGAASAASATKATGPNWRSYNPTTSPSRYFPPLNRVIANQSTTQGTDITVEALSSVARTLSFALTVRDNVLNGGQTDTDGAIVTVNGTAGPFTVSVPNTAVSWQAGTNQNVTWNVAGTTSNGVNAAFVDIYLSNDGGYTYPMLLASKVPNDGVETITVPNTVGSTNRIMVKGWDHIFYDISNTNFTITAPSSTFSVAFSGVAGEQHKEACQGAMISYTIPYQVLAGFSGTTTFAVSGQPSGSTVSFTPSSITTTGNVTMQISNTSGSTAQFYSMIVTATSGGISKTVPLYLNLVDGNFGTQMLTSPGDLAVGQSTATVLTWPVNSAATLYDVEVATDAAFANIVSSGTVMANSYTASGLAEATDYYWRVKPKNYGCEGMFSSSYTFKTGASNCTYSYSNNLGINVQDGPSANTYGPEVTKSITVPTSVTGNLNSVTVDLAFTHTYVDDLQIWITHPDGTPVYLWNHNCESEFSSVSVTYQDGNPSIPLGASCTPANANGTYAPNTPLSDLIGKPAAGTWVLHARDYWNGDTGTINNWTINFCVADAALNSESFEINDLSIYPNPNNGTFNLAFAPTSNDVMVNVYDIRGRQILTKTYQVNGLFDEILQLNNTESGVYLVTIQDGSRKITKKIVVE